MAKLKPEDIDRTIFKAVIHEGIPGGVPAEKIEAPKTLIEMEVKKSAFFRKISEKTGIPPSSPFVETLVSAVSDMGTVEQNRTLSVLSGETGTNCAIATLAAVSKLSGGELHEVDVLGSRGREPDFSGVELGKLSREQVTAMLKAIGANPGVNVVELANSIMTSIQEAQK